MLIYRWSLTLWRLTAWTSSRLLTMYSRKGAQIGLLNGFCSLLFVFLTLCCCLYENHSKFLLQVLCATQRWIWAAVEGVWSNLQSKSRGGHWKQVLLVCLWMRNIQSAGCAKGCCEWASSKEREGGGGRWWGERGGQVQGGWQQSGLHGDLRLKKGGKYILKIHSVSQCGERVRCKVFARYICDIRIVSSVKDWIQDLEQSPKDLLGPLRTWKQKLFHHTAHNI